MRNLNGSAFEKNNFQNQFNLTLPFSAQDSHTDKMNLFFEFKKKYNHSKKHKISIFYAQNSKGDCEVAV